MLRTKEADESCESPIEVCHHGAKITISNTMVAAIIGSGYTASYKAEVEDSNGNWHVLTTKGLYTSSANAAAQHYPGMAAV